MHRPGRATWKSSCWIVFLIPCDRALHHQLYPALCVLVSDGPIVDLWIWWHMWACDMYAHVCTHTHPLRGTLGQVPKRLLQIRNCGPGPCLTQYLSQRYLQARLFTAHLPRERELVDSCDKRTPLLDLRCFKVWSRAAVSISVFPGPWRHQPLLIKCLLAGFWLGVCRKENKACLAGWKEMICPSWSAQPAKLSVHQT